MSFATCAVLVQVSAAMQDQGHQEEDSGGEEDPEPTLRPHFCVQGPEAGRTEEHVSGADRVGPRGYVQQRLPGRSPSVFRSK